MMAAIKSTLRKLPLARYAYEQVRWWRDKNEGRRLFENYDLYLQALYLKRDKSVILHTNDGLNITIRQNIWDARIVREIFFDRPYVRHVTLPPNPIIVDIGGYIGDFSIYAAKYLNAGRVIVYEPTAENFQILKQNIENNGYTDRITAFNKAVSDSHEVTLNVQIQESQEVHVSAYWYQQGEQRSIPSTTLSDLFQAHQLDSIDLLKVDCEGGEYDIFPTVPDHVLNRIGNIVFEYHRVDGFETKLDRVFNRLRSAGFTLRKDGNIVSAYRV
jgi:FkbM family methyltransferase